MTRFQGRHALVLVVTMNTTSGLVIDTTTVERDGLAPIRETTRTNAGVTRYTYHRNRVEVATTPSDPAHPTKRHQYMFPVFTFEELDALIRSLPLRSGYEALLPLYSEGNDDAEVDTVRVEGRNAKGVWQIRFADKAVVATYGIVDGTRDEVSYAHTFRRAGPFGKGRTEWRRAFHACGPHARDGGLAATGLRGH